MTEDQIKKLIKANPLAELVICKKHGHKYGINRCKVCGRWR